MSCPNIEELLPLYLDGGCSATERAEIERHLAGCPSCRRVRAEFESLESSLRELAATVPPWEAAEARFSRRWGRERVGMAGRLLLAPGFLSGIALGAAAATLLFRGDAIAAFLAPLGGFLFAQSETLGSALGRLIGELASVNVLVLSCVYALLALGFLAGTLRFALRASRK